MPEPKQNGWNEYSKLILSELERHSSQFKEVIKAVQDVDKRITVLEVKAGLWGVAGGLVAGGIISFVMSAATKAVQ